MWKKIIYFCLMGVAIYQTEITAAHRSIQIQSVSCAKELQSCWRKLLKIPEIKALIVRVQKEGSFRIVANRHPLSEQFGAFWDLDQRVICVNVRNSSEGERIGSILFELHNAAVTSQYQALDERAGQGKIDRESYIQAFEYLEYQNSLKASKLAIKGISLGIFPRDAFLPTYRTFAEHYRVQRMGGHSNFIGRNYDQLSAAPSPFSSFPEEGEGPLFY